MDFTYNNYTCFIRNLRKHGYRITNYHRWQELEKCVILRHDIDYSPIKAVDLAERESELGVQSTFFVLITSDFYNIFSRQVEKYLRTIIGYGHEIGLHFDEVRYPELEGNLDELKGKIADECELLEKVVCSPVRAVSMHRPSHFILNSNLIIPGIANAYGHEYFYGFKYLSDSRHHWKESVETILESGEYNRLHILTHPFWYNEDSVSLRDALLLFVNSANRERYLFLKENFTDLDKEIENSRILGKHMFYEQE